MTLQRPGYKAWSFVMLVDRSGTSRNMKANYRGKRKKSEKIYRFGKLLLLC